MSRRAPLRRGQRLRPVSAKRRAGKDAWDAVYAEVDQRSGGRCEVPWCRVRATQHHHTVKPRAKWHHPDYVMHVCWLCHRQCDAPFPAGRLLTDPLGGGCFNCRVVYAPDKWAARAPP